MGQAVAKRAICPWDLIENKFRKVLSHYNDGAGKRKGKKINS